MRKNPVRTTEQSVYRYNSSKSYNGYTLFAPQYGKDVYIIDMNGQIVHHWPMKNYPGGDGELLPNGNLLRMDKTLTEPLIFFGSVSSQLVEYDWHGKIVWKYVDPYMHHDFFRMENGNTMINRHIKVPDDIAGKVKGGIPGTELEDGMWTNGFQEITPDGKIVWEWLGYEHLDFDLDTICPLCPRTIWGYNNAVYVLPNGDILTSFRDFNTIMIIDKASGKIKWRWGRPHSLGHQHNPTMLSNGNILVFDNGYHRLTEFEAADDIASQVIELNPVTNKVEWTYQARNLNEFYSPVCSGAERLPNGNTLICEAIRGRIFEVTNEKEIVWEFVSPFHYEWSGKGWTNLVYKAHRYGFDYAGLKGKKLDPERFSWVLNEKSKGVQSTEKDDRAERLKKRFKRLGY